MSKDYQPNSHYCFVCGVKNEAGLRIRFQNIEHGRVRVETQICDKHQGFPGIAHGGIVACIMDEVMGRAMTAIDGNRLFYTAKMEIKYRQHVPLDTDIVAEGWIIKDKGRVATAEGNLKLPDGTLAIEGSAMLFEVPKDELESMMQNERVGWQVYTDEEFAAFEKEFKS